MRTELRLRNFETVLKKPGPFLISLVIVTIFRNGFGLYGEQKRSFARGDHNFNFSQIKFQDPIRMLLSEVGNTYGWNFYLLLYSLIVVVFLVLALLIVKYQDFGTHKLFIMLSMLPGFTIILGRYGSLDLLSFGFSILAGLSIGKSYQLIFLIGMFLSHVESTFVVTSVVSLLFLTPKFREKSRWLLGSQGNYAATAIVSGIATIYLSLQSGEGSRMAQFPQLLRISLEQFLASGSWLVISWLGGLWYIFFVCLKAKNSTLIQYATILICTLGAFSIVTADGTRVAVNTLTLILVAFLVKFSREVVFDRIWVYAGLLFPAVNISNFNVFIPFRQLMYFFGLNPQLLVIGN
jgi:hypothetical protein